MLFFFAYFGISIVWLLFCCTHHHQQLLTVVPPSFLLAVGFDDSFFYKLPLLALFADPKKRTEKKRVFTMVQGKLDFSPNNQPIWIIFGWAKS